MTNCPCGVGEEFCQYLFHLLFSNPPLHILNAFPVLSLLCQESFSYQLIVCQGYFVCNYLRLAEIGIAVVPQHNLGVEALTLLGNYIPRCKAMDSQRNLTWEQYTPGNGSQDSILCFFLQTRTALDGSLSLSLAVCCHLNWFTVYKAIWKVIRITIKGEMWPL